MRTKFYTCNLNQIDVPKKLLSKIKYNITFNHFYMLSSESTDDAGFREHEEGANRGVGEHSIKFG